MADPTSSAKSAADKPRKQEWIPKIWDGMNLVGWARLLAGNRFRVGWRHWWAMPIITALAVFHTIWRGWQYILMGHRLRRTQIDQQPIFILGHWRSGTTLLHELLVLDKRHTYPTSYECFAPNHFLISEDFITRWFWFLAPSKRPMDNMAAGWDRPQEDEFALCNLGLPSPYLTIAFPNHPPQHQEYLTLEDVPPAALERWKRVFVRFLRELTCRTPKRIVLKSPPHTCRVRVLHELFPDARFIHIVRDPQVVFPSTVHLWKRLYAQFGFQELRRQGLEEHVLSTFERMYDAFDRQKDCLDESRFYELRYEDLVDDPLGQMRTLYERLDLGGFDEALPALEKYVEGAANYKTNRYQQDPATVRRVEERWGKYMRRYGYCEGGPGQLNSDADAPPQDTASDPAASS